MCRACAVASRTHRDALLLSHTHARIEARHIGETRLTFISATSSATLATMVGAVRSVKSTTVSVSPVTAATIAALWVSLKANLHGPSRRVLSATAPMTVGAAGSLTLTTAIASPINALVVVRFVHAGATS